MDLDALKNNTSFLDYPFNSQLSFPGVAYNGALLPHTTSKYAPLNVKPNVIVPGDYIPISTTGRGFIPPPSYPPRVYDNAYSRGNNVFHESH